MSDLQRNRNNKKLIEAVNFLKLEFPVKDISLRMGIDKGNLSSFLSDKKSVSKNFLEKFEKEYQAELQGFDYENEEKLNNNHLNEPNERYFETLKKEGIPLIPINAMAGFGEGQNNVLEYDCEIFIIPTFKGADFLITVKGSSMSPKYNSGDILACKKLPLNDLFFQWNKVYVLDTIQGALVKRIKKGSDKENVLIFSDNLTYDAFELHKSQINAVALVIGVIRLE